MHLRKLIWVCGFACALLANVAAALGLGEVRLNSSLNEPLNAEIKLLDTRGLSASQIIVTLASPADFERNGVDRPYFLTEFEFEILLDHPGGAIARVSSRSPVREPFVNFLVEARWPTGRLLREYTLLMDLPTFSDSPVGSSVQAPSARSAPARTEQPPVSQPRATPTSRSPETPRPAAAIGEAADSYTVGRDDTLWQIALDVRPDSNHSVHQTMLAIQRLNPDAFIDGNINLLRNGQVLRVPSSEDIQAVSRSEAVNEVARQNQVWSDDSMGAQLSATRRDSGARRERDSVTGSVRLATPGRDDATSGQGSGDNTGSGRALESELAASLEELDKTRSENQELSSRVRDLEEQIKTMERLVAVSNEQLRALQLSANQNEQATTEGDSAYEDPYVAGNASDEDSVAEAGQSEDNPALDEESLAGTEEERVTSAAAQTPVASEPVVPGDNRRVVAPPQASKTLTDHLMENLLWVLLGLLIIVVLVGAIIYRRRQESETDTMAEDDFFAMGAETADDEITSTELDQPGDFDADEAPLFDEEEVPAEAETGDVVGEADIYIAYGKFDQAEEMLLAGLAKDPESVDIRLKLLEVYSQTQDVAKFDRYYAGLIGVAGLPALARAAELRGHIAGAGEFDPTKASDPFASEEVATSEGVIDQAGAEVSDKSEDLVIGDELDFNFDLNDESVASDETESFDAPLDQEGDLRSVNTRYDLSFEEPAPATVGEDEEFSFDFDLDDAPETESAPAAPVELEEEEFTFALDDEPASAPEVESVSEVSLDVSEEIEDFNFELAEPHESSAVAVAPASDGSLEEVDEDLQLPEDNSDDFNLDMEMGDLDLAALDEEMGDLDGDFVAADEADELELELGDEAEILTEAEADAEEPGSFDDGELVGEELEDDQELQTLAETEDEFTFDELDTQSPPIDEEPVVAEPTSVASPVVTDEVAGDEEDVFDQALSELDTENVDNSHMPELDDLSDEDMDAELDFLADADEAATKLDLARAYIDMGDTDGARDILGEVAHEGNEQQRQEAVDLLSRIDA